MPNKMIVETSKLLSYALRHKPEKIGIQLDEHGWTSVDDLLIKANISRGLLDEVVATNNKKRFEFNEGKTKIRACQGHSVEVDLDLKPEDPPVYLYHGTSDKYLKSIKKEGLGAGNRNYVHLSEDRETAEKVGKRHGGKTVILRIKADEYQYNTGAKFYLSTNGVWLTEKVPVEYIVFPFNIDMDKTSRGFAIGRFKDKYDVECSIQESSLASEAALWMGCSDANPQILAYHVNGGHANGWVKYDVHPEASFTTRMHLTVEMAEALIPLLQKFVKTGGLQ